MCGPFTSAKKFHAAYDKIEYSGGMGETHASANEGIALALQESNHQGVVDG
jgi:hypothetical protein